MADGTSAELVLLLGLLRVLTTELKQGWLLIVFISAVTAGRAEEGRGSALSLYPHFDESGRRLHN